MGMQCHITRKDKHTVRRRPRINPRPVRVGLTVERVASGVICGRKCSIGQICGTKSSIGTDYGRNGSIRQVCGRKTVIRTFLVEKIVSEQIFSEYLRFSLSSFHHCCILIYSFIRPFIHSSVIDAIQSYQLTDLCTREFCKIETMRSVSNRW